MKRYQIFVSSSYEDLGEQRAAVIEALLGMGDIPIGMESFGAADQAPWDAIEPLIDQSDYFILILAHRYGKPSDTGKSYTEREYDHAEKIGLPVLAYLVSDEAEWDEKYRETDGARQRRLEEFKARVGLGHSNRVLWVWNGKKEDLARSVTSDLGKQKAATPRPGWIRGSLPPAPTPASWWVVSAFMAALAALASILLIWQARPERETPPPADFSAVRELPVAFGPESSKRELRIGIVGYDTIKPRASVMEEFLSKALSYNLVYAQGTAEEVLDWITDGTVDLAVLSPGAFAATDAWLTKEEKRELKKEGKLPVWSCNYLITPSLLPSSNPFASSKRRGYQMVDRRNPWSWKRFASGEPADERRFLAAKADEKTLYHPLCLTHRQNLVDLKAELKWRSVELSTPDNPLEIVKKAVEQDLVQFVFSDPLSLSGTIYPKVHFKDQLKTVGATSNSEHSFGFSDTLKMLMDSENRKVGGDGFSPRYRVGFLFDGAVIEGREREMAQTLQEVKSAAADANPNEERYLPDAELPAEMWVVRPDFDAAESPRQSPGSPTEFLRNRLIQEDPSFFIDQSGDQIHEIGRKVSDWMRDAGIDPTDRGSPFSRILDSMGHFERMERRPARLALVLSGGGAKCAYQAGAIAYLEHELARMRNSPTPGARSGFLKGSPRDIDLVVGSSGGALNALPTALEITRGGADSETTVFSFPLASLWGAVNLVNLLQLDPWAQGFLGVTYGLLLLFLAWLLGEPLVWMGTLLMKKAETRPWLRKIFTRKGAPVGIIVLMNCAPFILQTMLTILVIAYWGRRISNPGQVGELAPGVHWPFYLFWLPLTLTTGWIAVTLLAGTLASAARGVLKPAWRHGPLRTRILSAGFLIAFSCVGLVAILLLQNRTASTNDNLKEVIVSRLEDLLKQGLADNSPPDGKPDDRAITWSNRIWSHKRNRDFIIALTVLGKDGPADRYLHVPAHRAPPGGEPRRSVDLGSRRGSELHVFDRRERLLNLLIASCTIFPVFHSEPFRDDAARWKPLQIVDGGYSHNIPVEAAVEWGATHILVLEATGALDRSEKTKFWENLLTAFDLLFAQAQIADLRSRQKLEIYTLRPADRALKTLDFASIFTRPAIVAGYRDASKGRFVQYSRPPEFKTIHGIGRQIEPLYCLKSSRNDF